MGWGDKNLFITSAFDTLYLSSIIYMLLICVCVCVREREDQRERELGVAVVHKQSTDQTERGPERERVGGGSGTQTKH